MSGGGTAGAAAVGRMGSRLAALAILAGVGAVFYAGLVVPYQDWLAASAEQVDAATSLAAQYRRLAAEAGDGDAGGASPLAALLVAPDLSEAQAASLIQERLKGFAATAGIELQGVAVLPREDAPALQRLRLRLRGTGDVAGLSRFLHAVESARPVLVVDTLRLQSRAGTAAAAANGTAGAGATAAPLDLQLDILAFRERPA
ncbi:MAG TPA: type II secretion system protein GspM [Stellaceae bacterium]|jgi:hypothetical protein